MVKLQMNWLKTSYRYHWKLQKLLVGRMETRLGRNNLCRTKLTTVKTAARKIGHGRDNGQQKKLKLVAAIIDTVCSRQKLTSDSELCSKFCAENSLFFFSTTSKIFYLLSLKVCILNRFLNWWLVFTDLFNFSTGLIPSSFSRTTTFNHVAPWVFKLGLL